MPKSKMKIKIYQINLKKDTEALAFSSYDTMCRLTHTDTVNAGIYDRIFTGDVMADSLEDIYYRFLKNPDGFHGRSLSVSDVVEVMESDDVKPGFYFCDTIGFTPVDFIFPEKALTVIRYSLDRGAYAPVRAYKYDAGMDIRCPAAEAKTVPAHGSASFRTGLHVEIPQNCVGFLKSKSGLNVKHCITGEGVIDTGYTGEIVVKLYNDSERDYTFAAGDKLIQLVLLPIILPDALEQVDNLDLLIDTDRGLKAFGSSGK